MHTCIMGVYAIVVYSRETTALRERATTLSIQIQYYKSKTAALTQEAIRAKDELAAAKIRHLAEIKTLRVENQRNTEALLQAEQGQPVLYLLGGSVRAQR
jgi:hypothetical protein